MVKEISFDKHSLIIDGKRVYIKSGAFHYFRCPGYEVALDRFRKMKAAGYNAVDIYFNWGYHSEEQGKYDFSGIKDVRKVLQAAKETGLFVIARPGPFLNGELNGGGVPFWLLKDKEVIPRNRVGMEYRYSEKYMDYVTEWYDAIIPIINEFDNVILFQIENEYATETMEEDYMEALYQMARDRGVKCPIFHNDAYYAGLWADVVDIYAADIYPYINPDQDWKHDSFCFDSLDNIESIFRMYKEDAPVFIAEMQGGWFDKWNGIGYENMRQALGDEHINIMMKTALAQGVTIFNNYMGVGGTSWGNLACDEVYTSYDFTAGIDEYGMVRDNLYKVKSVNYFLQSFDLTETDMVGEEGDILKGQLENVYAKCREDKNNNCKWLFVRNMNEEPANIEFNNGFTAKIMPYDMKIMPEGLDLYACRIDFSDAEIFARLKNEEKEVIFMLAEKDAVLHVTDKNGEKQNISADKNDFENIKFEKDGKSTEFVFLTKKLSNKTWLLNDKIIFNVDLAYPDGTIAISENSEVAYFDLKSGFSKSNFKFEESDEILELSNFDTKFCAPEIDADYDCSKWKKTNAPYDALSCGMTDEIIWYKTKIPNNLEEITLSARHLFALYINGKEILNRNSYKYERLQQVEETVSVALNKENLNRPENDLTILVQNLGFEKGFSNETNSPRGLIEFATKPESDIEFFVNEKLNFEREISAECENPYLLKISKEFDIEKKENVFAPKYVWLKDFPYERATIFLNGIKIGRYLKNTKNEILQDKFYIPDAFLKNKNLLEIAIWERDININSTWDFKNTAESVIIKVGSQAIYQLY